MLYKQFTGAPQWVWALLKIFGGNSPGKNIHMEFVLICVLEGPLAPVDHPCGLFVLAPPTVLLDLIIHICETLLKKNINTYKTIRENHVRKSLSGSRIRRRSPCLDVQGLL